MSNQNMSNLKLKLQHNIFLHRKKKNIYILKIKANENNFQDLHLKSEKVKEINFK